MEVVIWILCVILNCEEWTCNLFALLLSKLIHLKDNLCLILFVFKRERERRTLFIPKLVFGFSGTQILVLHFSPLFTGNCRHACSSLSFCVTKWWLFKTDSSRLTREERETINYVALDLLTDISFISVHQLWWQLFNWILSINLHLSVKKSLFKSNR